MYINKYKQVRIIPGHYINSVEETQKIYREMRSEFMSKIDIDNKYSYRFEEHLEYIPFEKCYEITVVMKQEPLNCFHTPLEVEHVEVKDYYKKGPLVFGSWDIECRDIPSEPFYKRFNEIHPEKF